MNKKTITIFDNYDIFTEENISSAREFLTDYLERIPTEEEITDEIYFCSACDWDSVRAELDKFFDESENGFIVFGTVERWNGTFAGGEVFKDSSDFWNKNLLKDCDYVKISEQNGHLYITASHHDGTNHYEIKELTRRGAEIFDKYN